ncbi:MAG: DnaB-like helicase C-terminal domain-containing protein [Planctomycetota bacterium]
MNETTAKFQPASDLLRDWRGDVLSGTPPTFYPIGNGDLARIEIGPKLVTLIGGGPGAGKTAFTMQATIDALRLTPDLRAVVCNIEMPPAVLLDRQLARLSGVDLKTIRYRRLGPEHANRIETAMATFEPACERLAFVRPPFNLANVAATADAFNAGLIVLDYIQRIAPPGDHGDSRSAVDSTMDFIRKIADQGVAVIIVAAVSRSKDSRGRSTYDTDSLNLASFRESSELEFGADDAFILGREGEDSSNVILKHLKSRHGECRDISLNFNGAIQRFTATDTAPAPQNAQVELQGLWLQESPGNPNERGRR